jgi:hypothetical protein
MDAKESLRSAIDRFRGMVGQLESFIAESEKAFLRAGTDIERLEKQARQALNESSGAAPMGKGDGDPAKRLGTGLSRLDQHLEQGRCDTEKGLEAMCAVLAGIRRLSNLDGEFQTIVATLHALASTTHLENSRSTSGQAGFDTVVTDLRTMALRIKPKFGEVLTKAGEVRSTAEAASAATRTFLGRHRDAVERFRKDTQSELAAMTDACRTSAALATKSTEGVAGVHRNIAGVLQSLQVQDIARQMLEHVVQDLEEFAESAQSAVGEDASDAAARSWLAELAIVGGLEAAQLGNACDRLVQGLKKIESGLQGIATMLTELAHDSSTFSGGRGGSSILANLERGIRATTGTLRAHDAQQTSMMAALGRVSETTAGVEVLVAEVAQLGEDARFIGLNAMVKAVRVGQTGATLTVLAREIQNVSEQIRTFTSSATSIMRTVGKEARQMVGDTSTGGRPRTGSDVAGELESLMDELRQYQATLSATSNLLLSSGGALEQEVRTVRQRLQGLAGRTNQLRKICGELTSLCSQATVESRGAAPPLGREHSENRRHTMEDERKVQRSVLGTATSKARQVSADSADGQTAEGTIEFF